MNKKPEYFNLTPAQSALVEALKRGGVSGEDCRRIMVSNGVRSRMDNWLSTFPPEVRIAEDSARGRVTYYLVDDKGEFVGEKKQKVEPESANVAVTRKAWLRARRGVLELTEKGVSCNMRDFVEAAVLEKCERMGV